jgi:hypothetical protein
MRLLIDILHPAHVHVFRNLAHELTARGHQVRFTLREKECARDLLDQYGIAYDVLSRQRHGAGLAVELAARSAKLWRIVAEFRPHFLAGCHGPSIALVGRLRRMIGDPVRTAIFYDTEMATITNSFAYPLADYVCTPECYQAAVRGHHIRYPGYHELAYLHPRRFTANPESFGRRGSIQRSVISSCASCPMREPRSRHHRHQRRTKDRPDPHAGRARPRRHQLGRTATAELEPHPIGHSGVRRSTTFWPAPRCWSAKARRWRPSAPCLVCLPCTSRRLAVAIPTKRSRATAWS